MSNFLTGCFVPVTVSSQLGSLGGYGSRGYFTSGSLSPVDRSRPDAVYHFQNLRPEHLKREERVELYVKLVELLAAEDGET